MNTIQKECKLHGSTTFVKDYKNCYRCKRCRVDAVTRRRKKVKKMAVEYLGGKCKDCSLEDTCYDIYDFHHKGEKNFSISNKGHCLAWEKIKKELDICALLCANCHRKRHALPLS